MLTSSGDIRQPYETIGVVHASASRIPEKQGCGKAAVLPINGAYRDAVDALTAAAELSGGDACIHIGFDYRMASQQIGCNNTQPVFEVYAWGTAVRLDGPA